MQRHDGRDGGAGAMDRWGGRARNTARRHPEERGLGRLGLAAALLIATLLAGPGSTSAQTETGQPAPGTVLVADDFNDSSAGVLPVLSGNPAEASFGYLDGEYVIRQTDPSLGGSPISTVPGTFTDAAIGIDARVDGPTEDRVIMLACRQQADSNSHYRFSVRPADSSFELVRWDGQQRVALADWQPSTAIQPDNASNRLELHCGGATIAAVVNGVQVASVADTTYTTGQIWIGAGFMLEDPVLVVVVRFDNLVVTQL